MSYRKLIEAYQNVEGVTLDMHEVQQAVSFLNKWAPMLKVLTEAGQQGHGLSAGEADAIEAAEYVLKTRKKKKRRRKPRVVEVDMSDALQEMALEAISKATPEERAAMKERGLAILRALEAKEARAAREAGEREDLN